MLFKQVIIFLITRMFFLFTADIKTTKTSSDITLRYRILYSYGKVEGKWG